MNDELNVLLESDANGDLILTVKDHQHLTVQKVPAQFKAIILRAIGVSYKLGQESHGSATTP